MVARFPGLPRALTWCFAFVSLACSDADPGDSPPPPSNGTPPGLRVETEGGPIIGDTDGSITRFLGIPYAAPPVGELRWQAPRLPERWTEPLHTVVFGPACPQGRDISGDAAEWEEDCLTLNVWTPHAAISAELPVMVFIHGGAFRNGASSKPLYDGRNLAEAGNVVVVSMNYRLGSLGFLAHPALTGEDEHGSSGNYGLLDQVAALRWVNTNISRFGGDPLRVTLFGESAGSMSVCTHVASPLSSGLFQRAIGQSGSCMYFATPLRARADSAVVSAEERGLAFAELMGCSGAGDTIACLRAKSPSELLDAPHDPNSELGFAQSMPQPNIDGFLLTEAPASAFWNGRFNPIDAFIGGTNQDEATLFTQRKKIETVEEYEEAIAALAPTRVPEVLELYPPQGSYPTVKDAYDAFVTDLTFACPTRAMLGAVASHGVRAYSYRFEMLTAFGRVSKLGVFHGSELPFVFANLSETSGVGSDARAVSAAMVGYWTRFAATGDPNDAGAAEWPARTSELDAHLAIDGTSTARIGLLAAECDAMAGWFPSP